MQWAALSGFALLLGGQYFRVFRFRSTTLPSFAEQPGAGGMQAGVGILLASGAFLWTEYLSVGWSWVQRLTHRWWCIGSMSSSLMDDGLPITGSA
jgi:hypothetical protein